MALPSRVSLGSLVIVVLAMVMPAAAQCNSNDKGAPCFAGNSDILGGRGSLLQDDDLILNTSIFSGPGPSSSPGGGSLLTSNSTITQTSPTQITAANANNTSVSNTITIQGRLFDIDHDQILSAALVQNPGGQKIATANLEGKDVSNIVPPLSGINIINVQRLYGTSGNFLGGGFDQIVVAGATSPSVDNTGQIVFQVLSAADPTNATSGLIAGPVSVPVATPVYSLLAITAGVFTDPEPEASLFRE